MEEFQADLEWLINKYKDEKQPFIYLSTKILYCLKGITLSESPYFLELFQFVQQISELELKRLYELTKNDNS